MDPGLRLPGRARGGQAQGHVRQVRRPRPGRVTYNAPFEHPGIALIMSVSPCFQASRHSAFLRPWVVYSTSMFFATLTNHAPSKTFRTEKILSSGDGRKSPRSPTLEMKS